MPARSTRHIEVLVQGVAGTSNPLTLTATVGQTVTLPKVVTAVRSTTQGSTSTFIRITARTSSASQASSATAIRLSATTRTLTQAQTISRIQSVGAVRSSNQSSSTIFARSIGAIRSATTGQIATKILAITRSRSVTQGQSSSAIKQVGTIKSTTQAQSATFVKGFQYLRILSTTVGQAVTLVRSTGIVRLLTQSSSVTRILSTAKRYTATAVTTAVVQRSANRFLTSAQAQTSLRKLDITKSLRPSASPLATVAVGLAFLKTLIATQAQSISRIRSVGKALSIGQAQSISSSRATGKPLSIAQPSQPTIRRLVNKTLTATQSKSVTLVAGLARFKTLIATQSQSSSISRTTIANRIAVQVASTTRRIQIATTKTVANPLTILDIEQAMSQLDLLAMGTLEGGGVTQNVFISRNNLLTRLATISPLAAKSVTVARTIATTAVTNAFVAVNRAYLKTLIAVQTLATSVAKGAKITQVVVVVTASALGRIIGQMLRAISSPITQLLQSYNFLGQHLQQTISTTQNSSVTLKAVVVFPDLLFFEELVEVYGDQTLIFEHNHLLTKVVKSPRVIEFDDIERTLAFPEPKTLVFME